MDLLRVEKLHKHFGGLTAVNGVSFSVAPGERRAIIGPNGAGKTTLFNLLSGELPASSGHVYYEGEDITARRPYQRARLGMARTFQRNNLFLGLSVWENVRLAGHPVKGIGLPAFAPAESTRADIVEESLSRVGLIEQRHAVARHLSYGEQRQLEVAIALATQPKLLLLDEPAAGMSPAETNRLMATLREMPRTLTLLIIEHDMDVVFGLAERVTVLHYGEVIADGKVDQVRNDPRVLEVYLGTRGDSNRSNNHTKPAFAG
ncbi:MAG: ABC transporter ATP-binding protein [Chloroflexi bacterium]|nr:ABC transporter ATP-binding protein [Chloroflexota bacterium]